MGSYDSYDDQEAGVSLVSFGAKAAEAKNLDGRSGVRRLRREMRATREILRCAQDDTKK